ncbi:MAG: family penicillin-binding protein [Acidimicrobiales bacterium]|nr:family penicillin-binding protein [Acidimicrobiales bacterium]
MLAAAAACVALTVRITRRARQSGIGWLLTAGCVWDGARWRAAPHALRARAISRRTASAVITFAFDAAVLGLRAASTTAWTTARAAGRVLTWRPRHRLLLASASVVAGVTMAMVATGAATRVAITTLGMTLGVDGTDLSLPPLDQRSTVYADNGQPIAMLYGDGDGNREPITLDRVAPVMVQAVVDVEDANFWRHGGIDVHGLIRAATHNARAGSVREGGSTIAQQLVKNTLVGSERTMSRKLKEIVLADRLERHLGKRAILERYLNTVYFGQGAYGVQAAAETYFGRPASKLDVSQAALLAGLIQSPSGYDPLRHPVDATGRRRAALDRMVDRHHLDPSAAARAGAVPLPTRVTPPPRPHDYFTAAVARELLADHRLGATVDERRRLLMAGGLRVHTTVDLRLQWIAQQVIADGVPAGHGLSAALATVDPATGAVRALVGGMNFDASPFDIAADGGRQPGSSFKPFTLVAALEAGHRPDEPIDGSVPCVIPNPGGTPDPWTPDNFEGERAGVMTITDATAHSVNCAYARLALTVGPAHVADVAHRMGITATLPTVPSLTLGTASVPPLQMAGAYATLAANGTAHHVHLVDRVQRADGSLLFAEKTEGHPAIDPGVAATATDVLTHVLTEGTGRAAALADRPAAGKTGTAEQSQDVWFVGYTPQLATAVWMGDPAHETPIPPLDGKQTVGGGFPAAMWHAFMTGALLGQPVMAFPPPPAPAGPPPLPPGATGPSATTWCWSSCGRGGTPAGAGGPATGRRKH